MSGRSSLAALVDDAAGIEIVRSVRDEGERGWSHTVAHEAEVRAAHGDPRQIADRRALVSVRGVLLAAAPESERAALARALGGIGDEPRAPKVAGGPKLPSTVDALLAAHGDARTVVEMAALCREGDKLPGFGLTAPQMATLRAAAKAGGAGILRALALAGVRDDVALDVAALLGGERPQEARGDEQDHQHAQDRGQQKPRGAEPPARGADHGEDAERGHAAGEAQQVPASSEGVRRAQTPAVAGPSSSTATPSPTTEERTMSTTTRSSTALATVHAPSVALVASPGNFGDEHRRVVKEAFCAGATDIEFALLWQGAKSRGLDPVRRQIHFVKRWDDARQKDVWSSQVSIDGFRSIAAGTGLYDGQDEPEYETDPEGGGCILARVKAYRKDVSRPFVGVVRWDEFAQKKKNGDPVYMWAKMPWHMLGKCAEALALRKAFPEQLAGLYIPEEMGNQLPEDAPPPVPRAPLTAKDLAARIPEIDSPTGCLAVVDQATAWPKVRALAWRRMIELSSTLEELEQTRKLYIANELPDPLRVKLEEDAGRRHDEIGREMEADIEEEPAA